MLSSYIENKIKNTDNLDEKLQLMKKLTAIKNLYDAETQELWKEMHKWQREYRRKNQIILDDFFKLCKFENINLSDKLYFFPNGIHKKISKRNRKEKLWFNKLLEIYQNNDLIDINSFEKTTDILAILQDKVFDSEDSDWYTKHGILMITPEYKNDKIHVLIYIDKFYNSQCILKVLQINLDINIQTIVLSVFQKL